MRVKEEIVDHEPTRSVCDTSIITFKNTDLSRGAVKGHTATVVDIFKSDSQKYSVLTDFEDALSFFRNEFRVATTLDLQRLDEMNAKRRAREAKNDAEELALKNTPEMPELGEDAFKILK